MTAVRDRLAADLHAMKSSLFCWSREGKVSSACRPNAVRHQQQADRLIALGWTRLDAGPGTTVLRDGVTDWQASYFVLADICKQELEQARNTLDEERLARALALFPEDIYASPREMAAAIAKAYRDDHE